MGKTTKDERDIYYRLAKEEGWRARSAFKLLQLDEQFDLLAGVERVVDLCAAPGSWSQVLSKRLHTSQKGEEMRDRVKIVSVDLQPMAPLPRVIQIQGDITELNTANEILSHFCGQKAQLVICDGAPDVTGLHSIDEYMQSQLLYAAFNIASMILAENGTFVSKIFRIGEITLLYAQMKLFFSEVYCCKPKSSRQSSCEAFIICKNYTCPKGYEPTLENPFNSANWGAAVDKLTGINRAYIPFMACGDLSGFNEPREPDENASSSESLAQRILNDFNDWEFRPLPTTHLTNLQTASGEQGQTAAGAKKSKGGVLHQCPSTTNGDKAKIIADCGLTDECVDGMGTLFT